MGRRAMGTDYFGDSLRSFINDFASRDAVHHMADSGMTVTEITDRLSFPTKKELVAEMVWKRYLDTGRILLTEPERGTVRRVRYVKDEGEFGRTSLRRVVEECPAPDKEYIRLDIGRRLYKDRTGFMARIEKLSQSDRDYIQDLPWPLTPVWHVADDRMKRICEVIG